MRTRGSNAPHRGLLVTVLLGCGLLVCVSCSTDTSSAPAPTAAAVATPPLPATIDVTTTIPVTISTAMFGHTEAAACATDRTLMETAVEAYLAINGGTEATEAQVVAQGLLREESPLHDIGAGATVIPSPAGGCVS
jgi:hypothetical protein